MGANNGRTNGDKAALRLMRFLGKGRATCRQAAGEGRVLIEIDGEKRQGVASWGRRPTFDNGAPVFETHVFDFAGDLYGKTVSVTPVAWLRGEEKFDDIDALVAQMDRDSAEARTVLAALQPVSPLDRAVHWD